jgi:hypothetical protein
MEVKQYDPSPYGNLIVEIGRSFLGAPYKAGTLEVPGKEKLIVNLSGFDCTTYVETVLALAGCAIQGKITPTQFRKTLKFIRYRQGTINGYSSRLHYFTDWLRDNEKKKILQDVSHQFDAEEQRKIISYMTTHRKSYSSLKNEKEFQKMLVVEKDLSRKVFSVIGKDKISQQKTRIQNGDIIAITTNQIGCGACWLCLLAGEESTSTAFLQQRRRHSCLGKDSCGLLKIKQKVYGHYCDTGQKYLLNSTNLFSVISFYPACMKLYLLTHHNIRTRL